MIGLCPVDLFGFGLVKFWASSIMFLFPSLFVLGFMGIFSLNAGASVPTFCPLSAVRSVQWMSSRVVRKSPSGSLGTCGMFRRMWLLISSKLDFCWGSRFCE